MNDGTDPQSCACRFAVTEPEVIPSACRILYTQSALDPQQPHFLAHQLRAFDYVRDCGRSRDFQARAAVMAVLSQVGLDTGVLDRAINGLQNHAQVVIHFHPERLGKNLRSVAEGLLSDGVYRNQFETGLSSGSPTAFPDGERDLWERRMFGGAYHAAGVHAEDRPKYGALEIMRHPDGPSPRFGSCYAVLRRHVSRRSTFTFGGSQEADALDRTGTLDAIEPVLAALIADLDRDGGGLGVWGLTVPALLSQLTHVLGEPLPDPTHRPLGRALDSFVEAQVHGTIDLRRDVERMVGDPSFLHGPTGETLSAISRKYGFPLHWHPGFAFSVPEVPDYFRGYATKRLAECVAGTGMLTAAAIGKAAISVELEPERWVGWGTRDDILTLFRRLWHVVVLHGNAQNRN